METAYLRKKANKLIPAHQSREKITPATAWECVMREPDEDLLFDPNWKFTPERKAELNRRILARQAYWRFTLSTAKECVMCERDEDLFAEFYPVFTPEREAELDQQIRGRQLYWAIRRKLLGDSIGFHTEETKQIHCCGFDETYH